MGLYNESYHDDLPLFKKCYDRIVDEFKGDKIYIFHSLKEIYDTFPEFEEKYKRYNKFLESANYSPLICNDIIRLLLSHFIDDYVYIDSDIYIHKGFKNYLLERIKDDTKLVMFNYGSTSICYCKERFPELDEFMDKIFNDVNYTYDSEMNNKYGLAKVPGVEDTIAGRAMEAHFYSLFTIRKYVKKFLIFSGKDRDTEAFAVDKLSNYKEDAAIATDTWIAFKDNKNCVKTHHIPEECNITLEDIIKTCDDFGKKTYILERL